MSSKNKTKPSVFIIESLKFEDEEKDNFEGQIISRILKMSGIEHKYFYIRTGNELQVLLEKFCALNYRYLHISCHGNSELICTTLDEIRFAPLAELLDNNLYQKRLFLSACLSANEQLADAVFKRTGCYSLIGSHKKIRIDDAAIFWASFYQRMFRQNPRAMKLDVIKPTLQQLVDVHKVPIRYFTTKKNKRGWEEIKLT